MSGTRTRGHRRWPALTLALAGILVANDGCSPHASNGTSGQWYHAGFETTAGDTIPFFLHVPEDCETDAAAIVNGEERLDAACRESPVGFVVDFPVYGTLLEAWFKPDGTIVGHWCLEGPAGRDPILALRASPISRVDPRARFAARPVEPDRLHGDITGVWRVEFEIGGVAKGIFLQKSSGVVTGTIEAPSSYGDMRFLAGNVTGTSLRLSSFDGQRALALEGQMRADGTMEGEWIEHDARQRFVAERDDDLELPDPLGRVAFTPDVQRLELAPLRKRKFDGKAVIVQVFGTWCPNCNDHAPLLVQLYREHRAEGLEILGLAYEHGEDPEYKERRVRAFRKKHGVEWDIVIADSDLDRLAVEGLAGLSPIEGVPVTLFLNRDHTVHAIYSGFSGPATGESHHKAKARFEELTAEILGAR